ncbi:hypothetical protein CHLRE_06g268976v5 [Chlamydomonas reinhardtii]|uniref:Uncharacterized protein n=1 Tax=Chlamydomonas reinhardtii TaxID=3055 RepID=A0A2K3DN66_CHLRE|nr:uncharacterized protein CHLRE_06g268976v5 [Chlamydomonas reinhardtii]PNW81984.1 hypothetical protein CHLRE_06g268976v5 [Chlamydomonas reinhardtii]
MLSGIILWDGGRWQSWQPGRFNWYKLKSAVVSTLDSEGCRSRCAGAWHYYPFRRKSHSSKLVRNAFAHALFMLPSMRWSKAGKA